MSGALMIAVSVATTSPAAAQTSPVTPAPVTPAPVTPAPAASQAPIVQAPTSQTSADHGGWTFSITPYLWLPHVSGNARFDTPEFGVRGLSATVGPDSYLKDLRFAAMLSAEARKDNFLIATDLIYLNMHGTSAKVTSVNLPRIGSIPVSDSGTQMNGQSVIWTAGGGYALLREDPIQLDALVGFRFMSMSSTLNWNISIGPLGRSGSVSRSTTLMDGIVGIKGRIRIGDSAFYVPFYGDIGAAPASFTWQVMTGLGYGFSWGDLSLTYRYLQFQTTDDRPIQRLGMGGPMLGVRFTF